MTLNTDPSPSKTNSLAGPSLAGGDASYYIKYAPTPDVQKMSKDEYEAYENSIAKAYGFNTPTEVGKPSDTATDYTKTTAPKEDGLQSVSSLGNLADPNYLEVGKYGGVTEGAKQLVYDSAVSALSPIGTSLAGGAKEIVGKGNAVYNTLASSVNSFTGAVTEVLSGKILIDAASGLLSTAEKMATMVGEAAYQNVMGFLEAFKSAENLYNTACGLANDVCQNVKQLGNDAGKLLGLDMDELSWPDINFSRVKNLCDTETFTKLGTGVVNFVGDVKLPIGLSINEIKALKDNINLKDELLKKVEDFKNGVVQLGTEAINNLYSQVKAVNEAILKIAEAPKNLTSMVNNMFGKTDPLKERAANATIKKLIEKAEVINQEKVAKDVKI